jgi:hypothetical protein
MANLLFAFNINEVNLNQIRNKLSNIRERAGRRLDCWSFTAGSKNTMAQAACGSAQHSHILAMIQSTQIEHETNKYHTFRNTYGRASEVLFHVHDLTESRKVRSITTWSVILFPTNGIWFLCEHGYPAECLLPAFLRELRHRHAAARCDHTPAAYTLNSKRNKNLIPANPNTINANQNLPF